MFMAAQGSCLRRWLQIPIKMFECLYMRQFAQSDDCFRIGVFLKRAFLKPDKGPYICKVFIYEMMLHAAEFRDRIVVDEERMDSVGFHWVF